MNRTDEFLWRALVTARLTGSLTVTFPDGTRRTTGDGSPVASMRLATPEASERIIRGGMLGFVEAYLDGAVETDDLRAFIQWGAENQRCWSSTPAAAILRPLRTLWQRAARDRTHHRVGTMVDHYNLGNDFYAAWLDSTMTYSSARFPSPDTELEDAQTAKYRSIGRHAGLEPGMRVLEIGCGWGGFAEFAAREHAVDVVGLTVAEEQAEFARSRMARAGLSDNVEIRLQDFRDTTGEFDAVVSIEMIESVDETVWPALFQAFHERLRAGGRAVMQAITVEDDRFEGYRSRRDFIQRYIFPGGQVPAPKVIGHLAGESRLAVESRERFGLDYARTLGIWFERFREAWPRLEVRGLDQRFRRMWELYLAYCEAGFRTGLIDVEQWVFARAQS